MAEKQSFLIEKHFEPEELGDAYASSLRQLPGEEENLTPDLDVVIKLREMSEEEAQEVARRRHVKRVSPVSTVHLVEPIYSEETAGAVTASQAREFAHVPEAWKLGATGKGEKICVLDTGISKARAEHFEKYHRLVYKASKVPGEDWEDTHSLHGNWCVGHASQIAKGAKLMVIKVLSTKNGSGTDANIISGINDAVAHGATVISQSLGGGLYGPLESAVNAARAKGVSMPCAAGNAQQGRTDFTADQSDPGHSSGAVAVAAVDSGSQVASFSSWGNCVDIAALGVNMLDVNLPGGSPGSWSGTSMATPQIAGVTAIVRSAGADADAAEKALYAAARDTGAPAYEEGHGIADAAAAVEKVATPNPDDGYHPGVRRMNIYGLCHHFEATMSKGPFVLTKDGKDRAYVEPK